MTIWSAIDLPYLLSGGRSPWMTRAKLIPRLAEEDILKRVASVLSGLGCPNVRRGEGSAEWEGVCGSYPKTPDLVAGPLLGNGAPEDFLIDVVSPSGDQYVKPIAGAPGAARTLERAIAARGSFSVRDLGREYGPILDPLNKKLEKYSGTRGGTPMLGLAMYFCISGEAYVGPILAHMHAHAAIDDAFGLTSGPDSGHVVAALDRSFGPGNTSTVLFADLKAQLAFLLVHADKLLDGTWYAKSLLLVNAGVVRDEFAWRDHPVVRWLQELDRISY